MAYPRRLLTDDEEILLEFRPHWRALLVSAMWVVLGIAVVVLGVLWFDGTATWVAVGLAGLGIVILALPRAVSWWFRLYVLTTERIVVRDGVLSRGSTEIPLESITHVLFNQRIFERLLGYGDVMVESAGSQGRSRLTDIPDPEGFQSQIYRARENRSMHLQGSAPGGPRARQGDAGPRDPVAQLESLAELHRQGALTDDEFAAQKAKLLGQI